MNRNLVPLDRAARFGGGIFLLATPILDLPTYPYNLLGIVLIATAAVGLCPIYAAIRAITHGGKSGGLRTLKPHAAR